MKIQQLEARKDDMNAVIASRKTHGDLKSSEQQLQAEKDQ